MNQLHNIGVKDKRVLAIIKRMLGAEIEGVGVPTKGVPQGGILSPLLSNVVLNELDWWISSQFETYSTHRKYSHRDKAIRVLKHNSNLKRMYIVRYCDDFKIFTDNAKNAVKIYHGVRSYLWNNLKLDISSEKSTITNLRKKRSEFLGFELKAFKKKKYVAKTNVSRKKCKKILDEARKMIKGIQKNPTPQNINKYNAWVLGLQNYFQTATHVSVDFSIIAYRLNQMMYNRFKSIGKYGKPDKTTATYKKFYKNNNKTYTIGGITLFPLADIKTKKMMSFSQDICNYTQVGRSKIYKGLSENVVYEIQKMIYMDNLSNRSIEYLDNRKSKYSMQKGKCAITGNFLFANEIHCHHINPVSEGGSDAFNNLVIIHKNLHRLLHATNIDTINKYITGLSNAAIDKINKFRAELRLEPFTI